MQETFLRAWRSARALRGRPARSARGSTASPPTPAWTRSSAPRRVPHAGAAASRRGRRGCSPTPTRCSTSVAPSDDEPDAVRRRARDDRAGVPGGHPAAAAPPAGRADPARRARLVGRARPRRCWTRASPRPTARCSGRARRCRSSLPARRRGAAAPASRAPRSASCCERFIDAHERCDAAARWPRCSRGPPHHDAALPALLRRPRRHRGPLPVERAFGRSAVGDWRLVPDGANRHAGRRELPAAARATASSAPSSSTCCASRTARSPRSRPSAPALRATRAAADALVS